MGKLTNLALTQNGHIEGLDEVAGIFGVDVSQDGTDSRKVTTLLDVVAARTGNIQKAMQLVLPHLNGAYCFSISDGNSLILARDPWAFHPLAIGTLDGGRGYMAASESVVFNQLGVSKLRDVQPGEIVTINDDGIHSEFIDRQEPRQTCAYEFVYLARPDGEVDGVPVHRARKNMGRVLAEMNPIKADVIIPMPDTARAMAQGYGEATGIPIVNAIAKNPYVGRSFLLRGDDRATVLADKHRVIPDEVQGLRVIVAEDSVVKGNTLLSVGRALRAAGAKEIHVISAATRFERACFMGLDTGDPNELIAGKMTDAEMCEYLGIDSITFNTPEGMERAVAMAAESTDNVRWRTGSLCVSCATGEYPFKLADESKRDGPVTIGMPSFAA